jgi:flagellar basal body-associated protein FliL
MEDAHGEDAHGEDAHGEDAHGEDAHGEDAHGEDANVSSAHGDGHGEGESHGDGHLKGHHGHSGEEAAVADDPNKPEPIVPEGENIVINPAGSGGTRYLLVEIFLLRKDVEDTGFPMEVSKHTKQLQAVTVGHLSREDAQSLANPVVKERLKTELKKAYQDALGKDHPIKELIVSKWIMQ